MKIIRPKTTRSVPANRGIEQKYHRAINKLVAAMHLSVEYWMKAAYRKRPPVLAAMDATPSDFISDRLDDLRERWEKAFSENGAKIAEHYVTRMYAASDSAFRNALADAGWSVKFNMTKAMQDAFQATLRENVGLIKSIPEQYFGQVDGIVMRSYSAGRDLEMMVRELRELYPKAANRAELIARDQSNKANATVQRARQLELGIVQAKWMHSHAGKTPRPSHVAANEKIYNVAEGCLIDGEFIFPGEEINCFTGDMPVAYLPGSLERLWRSFFDGPMIHIRMGSDLLKGTPNHPILTARGWISLGELDYSDKVVCMVRERGDMVDHNKDERVTTFEELFEACAGVFGNVRRNGMCFNFYGDIPNGDVDEIVIEENFLRDDFHSGISEDFGNLSFPEPYSGVGEPISGRFNHIFGPNRSSLDDSRLPLGIGHLGITNDIAFANTTDFTGISENPVDGRSIASLFPKMHCNFNGTHSSFVKADDFGRTRVPKSSGIVRFGLRSNDNAMPIQRFSDVAIIRGEALRDGSSPISRFIESNNFSSMGFETLPIVGFNADSSEFFAELVRVAADTGRSAFKVGSITYEFRSLQDKFVRNYSGHVYTLQSSFGHYSISSALVQAKNCRCTSRSILPY